MMSSSTRPCYDLERLYDWHRVALKISETRRCNEVFQVARHMRGTRNLVTFFKGTKGTITAVKIPFPNLRVRNDDGHWIDEDHLNWDNQTSHGRMTPYGNTSGIEFQIPSARSLEVEYASGTLLR